MTDKIRELIKSDENFLRLFVIVDMNNNSFNNDETITEEVKNAFKVMSIDTYEYYNYLLDKWKNSNAEEKLEEAFRRNKGETFSKEAIEEAKKEYKELADTERGLYYKTLDVVTKGLDDEFINKTFYVYYHLALRNCFMLLLTLTSYFHLIKKYEGTEYGKSLIKLIEAIVNTAEVTEARSEYMKLAEAHKIADDPLDFTRYFNAVQIGIAFSEIIYYGARGQDFTKAKKEQYEEDYLNGKRSYLEDVRLVSTDDEDIASSLNVTLNNYIRVANLFERVDDFIDTYAHNRAEFYGIDYIKELELAHEEKIIKNENIKNLEKINTLSVRNFVRNKAFKKETIRELLLILSKDAETKALADALKEAPSKTNAKPFKVNVKTKEEIKNIDYSFKEKLSKKETDTNNHVNVSLLNSDLMKAHDTLATHNENDLERKIGERDAILEAIKEAKKKKQPKKLENLKEELEVKEAEIKETEERLASLKEKIEANEENLKELTNYYLSIDDEQSLTKTEKEKEKRKTKKTIKSIQNELTLNKKALNNRGLYLQLIKDLETGEDIITYAEGDIILHLENKDQIIKKFTYETKKLLRYLQNQVYYTPIENKDDFFLIDLDNYVEETGRAKSTIKNVREQLIEAVELLRREGFKVKGQNNKYGLKYNGVISFVDDYFIIERGKTDDVTGLINNTGKRTLAIHLGKTWREILFSEKKYLQWASIPKVLDRINDKDIDRELFSRTNANLVQELGHYLYETHRKDLKTKNFKKKKFKMGTLVSVLMQKGVLQTNKSNRYSRRVIEPIKDTFNFLSSLEVTDTDGKEKPLLSFETNAFLIYDGNRETNDVGLAGSKENLIKRTFEDANVIVHFNVTDEAYTKIVEQNLKHKEIADKKNKQKKERN